jgi:NADH-quinone oxidoreductase subunit H
MEQWKYFLDLFAQVHETFVLTLQGAGLPSSLIVFLDSLIGITLILAFVFPMVIIFIWLERRFIAWMQLRPGPNRCGPAGLLQPIADAIKTLFKELVMPEKGDKIVHWVAPILVFFAGLMMFAVIPIGRERYGALVDLNIGVLYIVAVGSIGVIGIFSAGWGSSNKYSLLASMRAIAQLVSYEVPMVLAVVGVALVAGSLSMVDIVDQQEFTPFILVQPLGCFIYFIGAIAELNRSPMDQIEAESELTTGYFTEYSGMKFATFFLGEYVNTLAVAVIATTLFLGGWRPWPLPDSIDWLIPTWMAFPAKVFLVFALILWMRATLMRVRIDQIMAFSWKFLLPVALINIFVMGLEVLAWQTWFAGWARFPWFFVFVNIPLAVVIVMVWSKLFFKLGGGRVGVRALRPRDSQGVAPDPKASVPA